MHFFLFLFHTPADADAIILLLLYLKIVNHLNPYIKNNVGPKATSCATPYYTNLHLYTLLCVKMVNHLNARIKIMLVLKLFLVELRIT